ncbi:MAG: efflux RND transporter periplasmic adaptor subunit [Acidobacteriota bacterium]
MSTEKPSLSGLRIDEAARSGGQGRIAAWVVLIVVLGAAGAAGWYFLFKAPRPVPVRVAVAVEAAGSSAGGSPAVLNASGYVTARRRATVSSKVTGKVVEVHVEEGMAVQKGQVLARLDDATSRKYLELAEAELVAARRNADESGVRLKQAQLTAGRTGALLKDGIVGQADLDRDEAEVNAIKARLDLYREQVAVSERQVAVRRNDVDDTVIRAPFSGVAISKDAQPGEMVSPVSAGGGFTRTGISTIVDMSSLEIEVDVNESYINRVTAGQPVEATIDAYPEWKIPAHVITMVPTADRQKATVLVRIGFEKLDPRMLPDMGVKVAFLGAAPPPEARAMSRLTIPKIAIRTDQGQDIVYVVAGDHVERRAIRQSPSQGETASVIAGLTAGDRVVIDGPPDLADGRKVEVR